MNYKSLDLPGKGDTVVVGMSGGVDSTLTALLLKQKGCKVIGATMSMWDGSLPENADLNKLKASCFGPNELTNIEECKKFCEQNDIEYKVIDVKKAYRECVLDYFKNEYRNGRTPNPCVRCNATVKFGAFLKGLEDAGVKFDYFCTGHYAKIVRPEEGVFGSDKRPCMIATAADMSKDQTYFLYRVPSEILEKVRFPLAELKKTEVMELARKTELEAAKRKESQDFVGEEFFDLIFSDKPSVPGDIIDLDGKVLGRHKGIEHYTVGQRRGLGVALSYPVYVHSIDAVNNLIVLSSNDELNSSGFIADDFVWPGNAEPEKSFEALVKIRLASKPVPCTVELFEDNEASGSSKKWKVTFDEKQRAVSPGQSAVFYKDNVILGGGIILKALS